MADIYGTAGGFRIYHTARDHTLPVDAADDDTVSAWLLVASEWIDARFRASFPGLKVGQRDQVREWPRNSAFDIYGYTIGATVIPTELINATYEVALKQGSSPGSLSTDYTPSKYSRVSIDGAISVDFASFASAGDAQTQFAIVSQWLGPILTGNGAIDGGLSGPASRV